MRRLARLSIAVALFSLTALTGCPAAPQTGVNKDLDRPKPATTKPG